jgi:cytochrome b
MSNATNPRKPSRLQITFLVVFHAVISGAFLVSYLTGDVDDIYFMHVFAGYAVLGALATRLAIGLFSRPGNMLRLPRPDWPAIARYMKRIAAFDRSVFSGRSPLYALMAVVLFIGVGLAAVSGAAADYLESVEDLHEALGEAALFIVLGHVALVLALHGLKRLSAPAAPASPGAKAAIPSLTTHAGGSR